MHKSAAHTLAHIPHTPYWCSLRVCAGIAFLLGCFWRLTLLPLWHLICPLHVLRICHRALLVAHRGVKWGAAAAASSLLNFLLCRYLVCSRSASLPSMATCHPGFLACAVMQWNESCSTAPYWAARGSIAAAIVVAHPPQKLTVVQAIPLWGHRRLGPPRLPCAISLSVST